MSSPDDDRGEMRDHRTFDDRTVEELLAGRTPVSGGEELAPLAGLLSEARSLADGPAPAPSAALAAILADGLPPATNAAPAPVPTEGGRRRAGLAGWRRVPAMFGTTLGWLTGLSMVGKAAVAVGTVGALAGGGIAIGLPDAVSDAFDRADRGAVADEVAPEPLDDAAVRRDGSAPAGDVEGNPATDASAAGRDEAIENAHDSARIPATVGPGTGEAQAPAGPETGEERREPAPAPARQPDDAAAGTEVDRERSGEHRPAPALAPVPAPAPGPPAPQAGPATADDEATDDAQHDAGPADGAPGPTRPADGAEGSWGAAADQTSPPTPRR